MSVLVGRSAPDFKAEAVVKGVFTEIKLSEFKDKKYVVLFFYPLDFTSVCNTEMHAFQHKLAEFHARKTEVLACSIDTTFAHLAWLKIPKNKGGIEGTAYPLLSDIHRTIARDYDVLCSSGFALRGLFIIDKKGIVRHQSVHEASLGRNIDEVLRTLDAIQHIDEHGDFCPANWTAGQPTLKKAVAE